MLLQAKVVSLYQTNCFLLGDEEAGVCALVDPGENAHGLIRMVEESGLALKMILLTHGHSDHVGAVPALRQRYPDVPVYVHPEDHQGDGQAAMYRLPPVSNVICYGDGDRLTLGGLTVEVLHTPGHTPGSVCLKVGEVLLTGDTLFRGSMGRTDFDGGSYEVIMASLKKLGELPGDYQVCPGHEGFTTLEAERRTNPYLREALRA